MRTLFSSVIALYKKHPLGVILFSSFVIRLVAVIFSKGFAMMDDHYLIIEQAQQWADDFDDNKWLPHYGADTPSGHSLFFVGLHYYILSFLQNVGITDSQSKMYFIRLLYALWSLGIIYWGYKIIEKLANPESARVSGWILGFLWLFPFLSVRQLVEFACIPFFLWSIWLVVKHDKRLWYNILIAGFIAGTAFSVRYQSSLIIAGIALSLIITKQFKTFFYYSLGALLSVLLLQGLIDMIIWKTPFAEFSEYMRYNVENRYNYLRGNWYNYLLLITGLLVPPVSLMLLWGWLVSFRKYLILFIPALIFLLFHIVFPNRQERFILPVLPLVIIQGVAGWYDFRNRKLFRPVVIKIFKVFIIFSAIINFILLVPLTLTYTKRAMVETMAYLKNKPVTSIVIDDKNHDTSPMVPRFYYERWDKYYYVSGIHPVTKLELIKDNLEKNHIPLPNYFLFYEDENLEERLDSMKLLFPGLIKDTVIMPGRIDRLMHFLNRKNKNYTVYVYRTPG